MIKIQSVCNIFSNSLLLFIFMNTHTLTKYYGQEQRTLFLSRSDLDRIPDFTDWEFRENVLVICLSKNNLTNLNGLEKLTNLKALYIYKNKIAHNDIAIFKQINPHIRVFDDDSECPD